MRTWLRVDARRSQSSIVFDRPPLKKLNFILFTIAGLALGLLIALFLGWLDFGPGWLFASMRDAIVVVDAETAQVALWNPAATELLGFTPEEALQLSFSELVVDLQETPQWAAARAGDSDREAVELFARRKSGQDVCVELTLSRRFSKNWFGTRTMSSTIA